MINYILLGLFALLLAHYIFFLIRIYKGLTNLNSDTTDKILPESISIIIPFRNEAENILENLRSIEALDYPKEKHEVIYVNDFSNDNSLNILLKNKFSTNIKIISVPDDFSKNAHKKRAVRYGIENSKGDIIVTTDADCLYEKNWLNSLLNNFDESTGFVSGPVEFIEEEGLFTKIQRLEFAGLVLTGAGLIGAGKPTICNAANIAYRKKVFNEVGGFKDQMNLSSGDDELLMQKISKDTKYNVKFSVNKNSIVKTPANKNFSEFYHQRKRWASKGLFYGDKLLVIKLILIYLFYFGLIIQTNLIFSLSSVYAFPLGLSVVIKFSLEYLILKKGSSLIFTDLSLKPFFITEILQIPYIIVSGFFGLFGNLHWKGRKLKR